MKRWANRLESAAESTESAAEFSKSTAELAENAAGFAPAAASPTLYKAIVGAKERIFPYTHNPYF